MNYLLALVPLAVGFYTTSFVVWLWGQRNKRGAIGTMLLNLLTMAVTFYAIFFREGF